MSRKLKICSIIIFLLCLSSFAHAQETITSDQSAKFIGQQKTVCGKVASAHYAARSKGQPTFLNLDKAYPNQAFTIVIFGSDRGKFEKPPEALYSGKEVCVSGTITSYQGKPQIVVKEPSQLRAK